MSGGEIMKRSCANCTELTTTVDRLEGRVPYCQKKGEILTDWYVEMEHYKCFNEDVDVNTYP